MPKLLPIVLSAERKSWRMLDVHADESDKRYHAIRQTVLERDSYTCQYCAFKADRYQEIHHIDHDHGHNQLSNLNTACAFCHMDFHLGMAGIRNAGLIIWCPEHTQADLNNLVRAIFIAVANNGVHEAAARSLYQGLETRASAIEEYLGKGASSPSAIGQAFLKISEKAYATRDERLEGLRLLPKMNAFGKQIAYWQSDVKLFGALADKEWERLLPAPQPTQESAEA